MLLRSLSTSASVLRSRSRISTTTTGPSPSRAMRRILSYSNHPTLESKSKIISSLTPQRRTPLPVPFPCRSRSQSRYYGCMTRTAWWTRNIAHLNGCIGNGDGIDMGDDTDVMIAQEPPIDHRNVNESESESGWYWNLHWHWDIKNILHRWKNHHHLDVLHQYFHFLRYQDEDRYPHPHPHRCGFHSHPRRHEASVATFMTAALVWVPCIQRLKLDSDSDSSTLQTILGRMQESMIQSYYGIIAHPIQQLLQQPPHKSYPHHHHHHDDDDDTNQQHGCRNPQYIMATSSIVQTPSSSVLLMVTSKIQSGMKRIVHGIQSMSRNLMHLILVGWRSGEIALRFSPLLILTPTAMLLHNHHPKGHNTESTSSSSSPSSSSIISNWAWKYTLHTIQSLGPAFIKISQWAATRPDIFPRSVCRHLAQLQDKAEVHGWGYTHEILEMEFGAGYRDWLHVQQPTGKGEDGNTNEDGDVIGSGSVAQVYRGRYFPTKRNPSNHDHDQDMNHEIHRHDDDNDDQGMDVAIKILHPNIHNRVERDLTLLHRIASILHSLPSQTIQMMNLPKVTQNFAEIMRHQLDLTNEGRHLHTFRDNFHHGSTTSTSTTTKGGRWSALPKVIFPQPILAKPQCLIEEYQDSIPISIYLQDDSDEGKELRRKLAGLLLRSFLKMVFMDNFIHSDLHQGNIQVKRTRVCYDRRMKNGGGVENENGEEEYPPWSLGWLDLDEVKRQIMGVVSTNASTNTNHGIEGENKQNKNPQTQPKQKMVEFYTIVFLDAGIVTSLDTNDQKNLKDLFHAVILNDGHRAGRLMVERAKYERCSQTEGGVEAFANGVAEIVEEFHDRRKQGLTLGVVRIGTLLSKVLDLCRVYGVEIDPAMSNVVMSTLVLEGLGRSLDADVNLFDIALPFVLGRGKV